MLDILIERCQAVVEAAGGQFKAVWELEETRLVLFNSPTTNSTLALPVEDVLEDGHGEANVRAAIRESDAKFDQK